MALTSNNLRLYVKQPSGACEGPFDSNTIRKMVLEGEIDERTMLAKKTMLSRDDFAAASLVLARHKSLSDIVHRLSHSSIVQTADNAVSEQVAPSVEVPHYDLPPSVQPSYKEQPIAALEHAPNTISHLNISAPVGEPTYMVLDSLPSGITGPLVLSQLQALFNQGYLSAESKVTNMKTQATTLLLKELNAKPRVVCRTIDLGCERVKSDQTLKGLKYGLKIDFATARETIELEANALAEDGYDVVSVTPIHAYVAFKGSEDHESGTSTVGFVITARRR
ncbi:hypothetical protein IC617_08855 [Neiella sp. HB171785]|uniref:Uncharacterized protein n=1 Tax=Neiella litorisoli TaxID=2771431 RepID=A0A8J6UG34_9GAMM|nr:hypothetical protein [Neiella litorisoli]MBD1389536.1 hypothetical protein [Neiella litorisoli]